MSCCARDRMDAGFVTDRRWVGRVASGGRVGGARIELALGQGCWDWCALTGATISRFLSEDELPRAAVSAEALLEGATGALAERGEVDAGGMVALLHLEDGGLDLR